jgi:hypothetical protein
MAKFAVANICGALGESPIGSKVVDADEFFHRLERAVDGFDFAPGSGILVCDELIGLVSSGEGLRTASPAHYVLREHRGEVSLFLKREKAAPCTFCAVVVYTASAYLADPDVAADPAEVAMVQTMKATHVLVAVIASSAPQAPLTPDRLVKNLAGGNKEALLWGAEEIRAKAKESADHWSTWCVVAG